MSQNQMILEQHTRNGKFLRGESRQPGSKDFIAAIPRLTNIHQSAYSGSLSQRFLRPRPDPKTGAFFCLRPEARSVCETETFIEACRHLKASQIARTMLWRSAE
jgi:hypothetical protein